MKVRPGAIEQLDDGHVDLPQLVRSVGTDAHLGLGWVDTAARPSPPGLSYQPRPRRRRRNHSSDTFRVQCESSERQVAMVIALDHFLHSSNLGGCQSCRLASWTARSIVKLATNLGAAPAVVAGRRQARDPQCGTQRYHPIRSLDRPKQCSFPIFFGKPLVVRPALRYTKHHDQQADNRVELSHPMTQFLYFDQKLSRLSRQGLTRDDIGNTAVKPASNRGPRNVQLGEQVWITGLADQFSNAVVVGTSSAKGRHHARIGRPSNRRVS